MTVRLLSVSESSTLLDCSWRHALAYTGMLTGDALSPRETPLLLREGRAWGRCVAAYHASWNRTTAITDGVDALQVSLEMDAREQRAAGLYDAAAHDAAALKLIATFNHYAHLGEPLPLYGPETELVMPLMATQRHSNRYRLQARLDGLHDDEHGTWIVEFKWRSPRSGLADFELVVLQRQLRWYAWAWREHTGVEPVGVILDERIGAPPASVRMNQNGRPSKVQTCTAEAYLAAGGDDPDIADHLAQRRWQARRRITFRPGEIDWAGQELRSLARLVHLYDTGQLAPVRNPNPRNCNGCRFRAICADPTDTDLIDALYTRKAPKHLRTEETHVAA